MGTVKLGRIGTGMTAALAAALILFGVAPAAQAAPGNPGVPGPPSIVFEEDFENVPNAAAAQLLANYTGAPPVSMTYTGHPDWLNSSACNGVISAWNATSTAGSCPIGIYNGFVRPIARGMGAALGGGDDNQVMSDVTISGFAAPATPAATLQTVQPVSLPAADRFVTFSIDAGAVTCGGARPLLRFFLLDGATEIPITDNATNACTDPRGTTIPAGQPGAGVRVGSYASDDSILFSGNELGVKLTNDQTSGSGNDYAVDNLRVLDATPQLDKTFESPTVRGQPTTLTFTVTNTSDLAAKEGWSFTDNLPAGLTVADQPNITSECANSLVGIEPNDTSIDVSGDLEAGEASCEITIDVVSPDPGTFENCAANVTAIVGLDPPGCSTLTVQPASDLAITKTDDSGDGIANIGEDLTYTMIVANTGPDDSGPATITDTLPDNVTYVSDTAGCDTTQLPVLTCTLGALDANTANFFEVTVNVDQAAASSVLTNHAEVDGPNPDLNLLNNEDEVQTAVPPLSDMALTKTASVDVADPGEQVTYTIDVTNNGPDDSNPTTVTDTLPDGVTYVSDTGSCNVQGQDLTCPLGPVADAGNESFTVTVTIDQDAASTVQTNTATVEGSNPDQNPDNNTDDAAVEVPPISDLQITKTGTPSPVRPGENITYTLSVTNSGPTDSTTTTVSDDLPAGLALVSATPDQGSCNDADPISCDLGPLAEDATAEIVVVATVSDQATGEIQNTATVTGNNPDPNTDNNSDTETTQIARADLAITKEPVPHGEIFAGDDVTYTLTVTNNGPQAATGVEVADDLPDSLTLVSATPDQGTCNDSDPLSCDLGTIPASGSVSIELVATVGEDQVDQQISNTASVDGIEEDTEPDNNSDTAPIEVEPEADLQVTKTAGASEVAPGDELTYTLEVTNAGPSDSDPTILTDTLPDGLDYVSDDAGCDASALPEISCDLGALSSGASQTIQVVTTVSATENGELTNSAGVAGPIADPDLDNNVSEATTEVVVPAPPPPTGKPKLSVKKSASTDGAHPGEVISYRITVRNKGKADAKRVKVCDRLPGGQQLLQAPDASERSSKRVCWKLKRLKAGAKRTFKVVTQVKFGSTLGTQRNKALVKAGNAKRKSDVAAVRVVSGAGPCPDVGPGLTRC